MKVVVAPDKFAGTLSAPQAAAAISGGWRSRRPHDEIRERPMSDGGPGFIEVLAAALDNCERIRVDVTDPLGRRVPASVLLHRDRAGGTAYVESAEAVGLHLLSAYERDPERATSAGLAPLIQAALRTGARRIVVGLGGTATSDGGEGFIRALLDRERESPGMIAGLRASEIVLAADVPNPLLGVNGAAAVFAPQKGADREAVARLEGRVRRWTVETAGFAEVADMPGAGAAGGLGAALLWLGGHRMAGADLVAMAVGLGSVLEGADLVITGEGAYDATSLRAKVVAAVAGLSQSQAVPCVVIAGQTSIGPREAAAHGVHESIGLAGLAGSIDAAKADPAHWLAVAADQLAGRWVAE